MNAKIKYTDEPLGETQVVTDFLPSPSELSFSEEGVKVTLALSKKATGRVGKAQRAHADSHAGSPKLPAVSGSPAAQSSGKTPPAT